jgi:hypothetical protein
MVAPSVCQKPGAVGVAAAWVRSPEGEDDETADRVLDGVAALPVVDDPLAADVTEDSEDAEELVDIVVLVSSLGVVCGRSDVDVDEVGLSDDAAESGADFAPMCVSRLQPARRAPTVSATRTLTRAWRAYLFDCWAGVRTGRSPLLVDWFNVDPAPRWLEW